MARLFLACLAFLSFGCLLVGQDQNPDTALIMNGETLRIEVWREADVSRTVNVKSDGDVMLPIIGNVKAEGLTPAQLSQAIQRSLSSYINDPHVRVTRAERPK
jgi:protein involved in polysaccharide export with SLBB domain